MRLPGPITIQRTQVFSGPNLIAPWPCATVTLSISAQDFATERLARITSAAEAVLSGMPAPMNAQATAASHAMVGDLVARLAIGLQSTLFACEAHVSIDLSGKDVLVAFGYADPWAATVAASRSVRWLNSEMLRDGPTDASALKVDFDRHVSRQAPALELRLLLDEVTRRGIPWRAMAAAYRVGWGASQRWLSRIMTDRTPSFSVHWATYKPFAAEIMTASGIPTPEHFTASDAAEAVRIARRIGYPVVMKPAGSDEGVGVRLGLRDARAVELTFPEVRRYGKVLVQREHPGSDYRLMVVDGRMIAAARRIPAHVIGDGEHSVQALIEAINADPRRGENHTTLLERIQIDPPTLRLLAEQNLDLDAIPSSGRKVLLRRTANLSTGGTSEDVTDRVHPDNRVLAERAARAVGLDIAGIDFLCPDISRSHREVGGVVCEINPNPGFRPHLAAPGSPDVTRAIVDAMFPNGSDGRPPIALITGTVGKTTTCRMVGSILRMAGHTVGLATTAGVQIDDAWIRDGDEAGPRGAGIVLSDRSVTAAVLETARGGILRFGVGPDRYRVGALLNVGTDHVGTDGVDSVDALARVKSRVLAGATHAWVLNADDPHCLALAAEVGERTLILVGRDVRSPAIARHLELGGQAVVINGDSASARVVALQGGTELLSIPAADIPATYGGLADFNVDNARYATAISLAMGADSAAIVGGLTRFRADARWSPSRVNLHTVGPIQLMIDYCCNAESFDAIGRLLMRLPVSGRRTVILDVPGNRADVAYRNIARVVAARFDRFICTTSLPRGRPPGEVSNLLCASLQAEHVTKDRFVALEPFDAALEHALRTAEPGDLVLVPAETPGQVLDHPACKAWSLRG